MPLTYKKEQSIASAPSKSGYVQLSNNAKHLIFKRYVIIL